MGCCSSKPDPTLQETHIPQTNQQVPPIVITKAQSLRSVESLPASTSANAIPIQPEEKNPTKIDPPAFEATEHKATTTLQDTKPKPVIISTPIPPDNTKNNSLPTHNSHNTTTWTILVRLSNSAVKDILVDIPTTAPFLTVSDLKKKVPVEPDQLIKLIHLGRILQDDFKLVPSTIATDLIKSDTIKVSNRGVIQAMIYKL
ncbi:hypothetical protein BDF21DRAFT_492375 [Thamnidium elegans]|nr:hypothetical protein BDF21DRAFT_492375 [Thamnidium elegans]